MILGVSSSLSGLEAARFAVRQARRRSVPLLAVRTWMLNTGPRSRPSLDWERALAAEARRRVDEVFELALGTTAADLNVMVRVPSGSPAAALRQYVTTPDDLIVVGAPTSRWWGGTTVRRCVRSSPCPVIVVPPPALSRIPSRRLAQEAIDYTTRT
ncbi:Nucleotide-binding universal stress protein, UspA family [Paractinoplanes atraurantiacus]|uniref:Nucleotide-binding universal stress protein, UspA family n=1 Tax=Paractinoplanes atraurantiacus TaxID=1036182 RepID=A0A285GJT8_9ACTN|nr:Nucleotide-binding universal stress protein, UspA family [Actinoplanes atraurantiacus]